MAHFCHPIPIKKSSYLPALSQREVVYFLSLFSGLIVCFGFGSSFLANRL